MQLHTIIPVDDGQHRRDAAILWKHVGGKIKPLKIDSLRHYGVKYGVEPLTDVLQKDFARIPQVLPLL